MTFRVEAFEDQKSNYTFVSHFIGSAHLPIIPEGKINCAFRNLFQERSKGEANLPCISRSQWDTRMLLLCQG